MAKKKTNILIVGAGEKSALLIDFLCKNNAVDISGVADANSSAQGIKLARKLHIRTSKDWKTLIKAKNLNLIIETTGRKTIYKALSGSKPAHIDLIGGDASGMICQLLKSRNILKENLTASEEEYAVLTRTIPDILYKIDEKGRFTFVSDTIKELGHKPHKLIGKHFRNIVHPDDFKAISGSSVLEEYRGKETGGSFAPKLFDERRTGKRRTKDLEIRVAVKNKQDKIKDYCYVRVSSSGMWGRFGKDDESRFLGSIGIMSDISESKKAAEELRTAYEKLKETQSELIQAEKMQVIGTLASGIAHEVKNPLAIIFQSIYYLSKRVLIEDESVEGVALAIKYIEDSVKRADDIIKGILDFSGASKIVLKPENLNSVIDKSLLLVNNYVVKHHVKVVKNLGNRLPRVKLNRNRMEQVFINLFINAVQAMPDGGQLTVKTYVKKLKDDGRTLIGEIEDAGSGIPEDILDRIFDPFLTTKQSSKEGVGLGLSIVRRIIEFHNAKITIKNRENGHGVKVVIMFKIEA